MASNNTHEVALDGVTVCRGFLLGATANADGTFVGPGPLHAADRRDRFCKACVSRAGLGARTIDRARIRVVPSTILEVGKQTCQLGDYWITRINRSNIPPARRAAAARGLQVRKRHKVAYMGGSANVQKVDFVDARGMPLPVVPSNGEIIAVEVQEVGGSTHHTSHAVGTARVPPKHCGPGASLVIVFATADEAGYFEQLFAECFGVPLGVLVPGEELFVFDAKRAAFAPYCSIQTRVANYAVPACKHCAGTQHRSLCLDDSLPRVSLATKPAPLRLAPPALPLEFASTTTPMSSGDAMSPGDAACVPGPSVAPALQVDQGGSFAFQSSSSAALFAAPMAAFAPPPAACTGDEFLEESVCLPMPSASPSDHNSCRIAAAPCCVPGIAEFAGSGAVCGAPVACGAGVAALSLEVDFHDEDDDATPTDFASGNMLLESGHEPNDDDVMDLRTPVGPGGSNKRGRGCLTDSEDEDEPVRAAFRILAAGVASAAATPVVAAAAAATSPGPASMWSLLAPPAPINDSCSAAGSLPEMLPILPPPLPDMGADWQSLDDLSAAAWNARAA